MNAAGSVMNANSFISIRKNYLLISTGIKSFLHNVNILLSMANAKRKTYLIAFLLIKPILTNLKVPGKNLYLVVLISKKNYHWKLQLSKNSNQNY